MPNKLNIIKLGDDIAWEVGNMLIYPINKINKKTKNEILNILKLKKDYYKGMKRKKELELL